MLVSMIVIDRTGLDGLIDALQDSGRTVIGPTVRDGVITHDVIEDASRLPIGWADEQRGGSYRLIDSGTSELFGFSTPSTSWKRFVYPERTMLIRARRSDDSITIEEPEPSPTPLAFFGIRPCDLAGLQTLDKVFLDPAATDPNYHAVRADIFIVAVACNNPGATCFCASMDTGPNPRSGFDLSIVELYDDERHEFVVEAGSGPGEALERELVGRRVTEADRAAMAEAHERAVAGMGRTLHPEDPPLAAAHLDHERWDDVASRCLDCGNCTMVCPTCFCGATEDTTNLAGDETERWRVWDSCFTLDFSSLQEGAVRSTTKARYRQWLLHKLVTWHEQFDSSGCVGCGRCITWCPVGIDLTEEIAALATPLDGGKAPVSPT